MSIPTAGQGALTDALKDRLDKLDAREAIQRVALALADLDLNEKHMDKEIIDAFRKFSTAKGQDVESAAMIVGCTTGMKTSLSIALDYIYDALMGETNG